MHVRRKRYVLKIAVVVAFAMGGAAASHAQDLISQIKTDERLAHSTTLYLDCQAAPRWEFLKDEVRLRTSWESSYSAVKRSFSEDGGALAKYALLLESMLTRKQFSTHATFEEVLDKVDKSGMAIYIKTGPAFSYSITPLKVVVTTSLIRHACDFLLPTGDFSELLRKAQNTTDVIDPTERQKQQVVVRLEASKLVASFIVRSIRYTALKIFVLAHEATHLALDRYSGDLEKASGFQGETDCLSALIMETRADRVGINVVCSVPVAAKIDEALKDQLSEFSKEDIDNFVKLALVSSYYDQLEIVEKETEWLSYSSCQISPLQRRDQLASAVTSLKGCRSSR